MLREGYAANAVALPLPLAPRVQPSGKAIEEEGEAIEEEEEVEEEEVEVEEEEGKSMLLKMLTVRFHE